MYIIELIKDLWFKYGWSKSPYTMMLHSRLYYQSETFYDGLFFGAPVRKIFINWAMENNISYKLHGPNNRKKITFNSEQCMEQYKELVFWLNNPFYVHSSVLGWLNENKFPYAVHHYHHEDDIYQLSLLYKKHYLLLKLKFHIKEFINNPITPNRCVIQVFVQERML